MIVQMRFIRFPLQPNGKRKRRWGGRKPAWLEFYLGAGVAKTRPNPHRPLHAVLGCVFVKNTKRRVEQLPHLTVKTPCPSAPRLADSPKTKPVAINRLVEGKTDSAILLQHGGGGRKR